MASCLRDCRILRFASMPTKQTWRSMPRSERYSSDMGLWDTLHVWLHLLPCDIQTLPHVTYATFFSASCDVACSLTWKWKMCELTRAVQLKSMKEIWRKLTQVIPILSQLCWGLFLKKKKNYVNVGCMNYVRVFWSILPKSSDRFDFFIFIHIGATPKWSNYHLIKGYVGWF